MTCVVRVLRSPPAALVWLSRPRRRQANRGERAGGRPGLAWPLACPPRSAIDAKVAAGPNQPIEPPTRGAAQPRARPPIPSLSRRSTRPPSPIPDRASEARRSPRRRCPTLSRQPHDPTYAHRHRQAGRQAGIGPGRREEKEGAARVPASTHVGRPCGHRRRRPAHGPQLRECECVLLLAKHVPPPLLAVGADLADPDPQHTCPQASQAARRNQAAKASASRARMRIQGDEFDARFGYVPSVTGHARASKPTARRCHHPLLTHYRHDARRYPRFEEGPPRVGWLLDMSPTTVPDEEGKERSGLDLYFLQQDGDTFKVRRAHRQNCC